MATSKALVTTRLGRGTECYRAPEVLGNDSGRYNNRSDMFALGCIIFKVITGDMAFTSDWEINKYANEKETIFPARWPPADPGTQLYDIGALMSGLLTVDPIQRPGAIATEKRLHCIQVGVPEYADNLDSATDPFFSLSGSNDILTNVTPKTQPVVQAALRFGGSATSSAAGEDHVDDTSLTLNELKTFIESESDFLDSSGGEMGSSDTSRVTQTYQQSFRPSLERTRPTNSPSFRASVS
jgi:serine/threonine protein kinase